jgi:hypothetical protein
MDFLVRVVQSPGYIFGPLMLLAGLVALALCVRAALRPGRAAVRQALTWSLVPTALGVLGAIFGAIVRANAGQAALDSAAAWTALGCTVLFGVFTSALPVVWSFALLWRRPPVVA